jgi:hypothetical protein
VQQHGIKKVIRTDLNSACLAGQLLKFFQWYWLTEQVTLVMSVAAGFKERRILRV